MPCQGSNDRQEDDRQSRHRHSGLHSLIPADDSDRHNIQDPKTNLSASPEIIDRDAYHQNERGEQILGNNALSSSIHNAETESGPPVFEISSHPPANQDETNWKDTPNALRSKSTSTHFAPVSSLFRATVRKSSSIAMIGYFPR